MMHGMPRLVIAAVGVALAAGITAAATGCGGSSGAHATALAAARTRAAQARAVAAQAGLGPDVQDFLAAAAGASSVTYTVVYDQGGGQSTTVIARAPDRRIDVVGGAGPGSTDRIVVRDSDTVVCHLDARRWTCVSGVTSAPGGPFTPEAISSTIGSLAQLSQTYDFSVSGRRMLGLAARCLTATRRSGQPADATVGDHAVICIAPSGVILRVDDGSHPVQATSYRESVPAGAFDLPAHPTPAVTSTSAPTP
jgi:hypothetical protein